MDDALDLAAAEYVLGTLPAAERAAFLARLARDPVAVEAVRAWNERLAALHETLPELAPPQGLRGRIERSLDPANDPGVARGWRTAAIAVGLVALVAGGAALRPVMAGQDRPMAMAAVSTTGETPALLVTWHPDKGRYELRAMAMPSPGRHSHQLWLIVGDAAPRSLGLVRPGHGWIEAAPAPGAATVVAVSIEPPGGSPTGSPTGPVVMTGKLVRMDDAT